MIRDTVGETFSTINACRQLPKDVARSSRRSTVSRLSGHEAARQPDDRTEVRDAGSRWPSEESYGVAASLGRAEVVPVRV